MNDNKNKNETNTTSKYKSLSSLKLPKITKLNKSLIKNIKIINNDNDIPNFFSSEKKLIKYTNFRPKKENKNIIQRYKSDSKFSNIKSKMKHLYVSTSHSFKKKKTINKETKLKIDEDDNIHPKQKYSKNLMDNLNNKLFSPIIATDLMRPAKDKELLEQDFEKEVRNYQLLQIIELNNRIREGEAIKSVNDMKELYDMSKNSNIYNS